MMPRDAEGSIMKSSSRKCRRGRHRVRQYQMGRLIERLLHSHRATNLTYSSESNFKFSPKYTYCRQGSRPLPRMHRRLHTYNHRKWGMLWRLWRQDCGGWDNTVTSVCGCHLRMGRTTKPIAGDVRTLTVQDSL